MNFIQNQQDKTPQDYLMLTLGLLRGGVYIFFAILIWQMKSRIAFNVALIHVFIAVLVLYGVFRLYRAFDSFKNK